MRSSTKKHSAHLVLLKVVWQDVVLAKANAAGNGLFNAHDQPEQRALPAPIGACSKSQLPHVGAPAIITRQGAKNNTAPLTI